MTTATQRPAIAAALLTTVTLAVYLPTLSSLVRQWASDENYSHGFLVVPCALYFAWQDRARMAARGGAPRRVGFVVVAAALMLFLAGQFGAELFLSRVSLLVLIAGLVVSLAGMGPLRSLAFPLTLALLAIPLPAVVFNRIAFPLQLVASQTAETVLSGVGIPVLREGNVLVLPAMTLEVAQACSGIRSLVSLVSVALLLGRLAGSRPWPRALLAAMAIPIAIVANAARVAGTAMAAEWIGPAAAQGFFHEFAGWVVFVTAFALLLGVHRLLRRPPAYDGRPMPAPVVS
ncbi:MAG TPA: exosortase/archaeosortase family protein [Vicinamibacterales bacterium]|jgi:exosortase